jgi:hypothetical protein
LTAGTCCRRAADSSWHAEQILAFGIDKLTVVMSPCVIRTWQTVQGESMAEWTDFPVIFCTWHAGQPLSTNPGCSAAQLAGAAHKKVQVITRKTRRVYALPLTGVSPL